MRKILKIWGWASVCSIILGMSIFIMSSTNLFPVGSNPQKGTPVRFYDNGDYLSPVLDWAVDQNILYVLYETKSVIKCYDLDGTYLHSYHFLSEGKGRGELRRIQDSIVLRDNNSNLYFFENGSFIDFLDRDQEGGWEQAKEILRSADRFERMKYAAPDNSQYDYSWRTITRTYPNGQEVAVVTRPIWTLIFRPVFGWALFMIGLSSSLIIGDILRRSKT